MSEKDKNNFTKGEAEQLDDEFIPNDARPLCLKCFTACHPLQYYCHNCDCDDAINPLTPYIGFVNIRFNYGIFLTMWRKLWHDKNTSIISRLFYLFMITMQVPGFIVIGLPLLLIYKIHRTRFREITMIAFFIIAIVLFILFFRYKLFTGLVSSPIIVNR